MSKMSNDIEDKSQESELNVNIMELPAYPTCNQILEGGNPADEMEDKNTSLYMMEADVDEPIADEET